MQVDLKRLSMYQAGAPQGASDVLQGCKQGAGVYSNNYILALQKIFCSLGGRKSNIQLASVSLPEKWNNKVHSSQVYCEDYVG